MCQNIRRFNVKIEDEMRQCRKGDFCVSQRTLFMLKQVLTWLPQLNLNNVKNMSKKKRRRRGINCLFSCYLLAIL